MDIKTNGNVRYYTGDITPGDGIVMVFGSNPEGRHGAGAAKVAREQSRGCTRATPQSPWI